ncbi:MAG: peptidyl-prolyl cis-trans isomerase [Anaerolineales bacterium]|nr:peptidyl-prolyl cis-trans isomerase [Anaerolineales bacterium]
MRKLSWLVIPVLFMMVLSACGAERPTPVVYRPTIAVTETAAANQTLTHLPPTAGPSPTPTVTSTPYQTATPFPDADPAMVVAKVGSREITLAEFQARVRYERWLPLQAIAKRLDKEGPSRILDFTRPETAQIQSLFYTLSNTESMGTQTMNAMLTEQVILREAALRDLELDKTFFDGRVAARIGVELGAGGARPRNWDEAYAVFIADMQLYTGMTEQQFIEHVRALTYYDQLSLIIGDLAPDPTAESITAVNVQDLLLDTREDAATVADRMRNGESILRIAVEYGLSPTADETERRVSRSDDLPEDILNAIFAANEGDVIGPFATDSGWYVARIGGVELDIASPSDLDAARKEFVRLWIVEKLDDPTYTVNYENWMEFVPTDPLPQDVSPMMRDEFVTYPDNPFVDVGEPTPTPEPLSISPR